MLLRNEDPTKRVLIFAGTKKAVKELNNHLKNKGFKSNDIHSDLEQQQREDTLMLFKNASVPILVATDVLSRGIDIKGIEVVINFDRREVSQRTMYTALAAPPVPMLWGQPTR